MLLAFGMACAAFERAASGKGQVVDAAMIDGAALMLTPFYAARASGFWGPRGTNFLDTGAPFYEAYETADGGWVAVGAIEPQFYAELRIRLGLADDARFDAQWDKEQWPAQKELMAAVFLTKTRDEWCAQLEHSDACFAPVLAPTEAPDHPHHLARQTFLRINDVPQPAPAPRFSRTPATVARPPTHSGDDDDEALAAWGFTPAEIAELRAAEAIA
jgi:alpha-methylacyl-CoA racemase